MTHLRTLPLAAALAAGLAASPIGAAQIGSAVTLELVTDQGSLPLYPAPAVPGSRKAYAEARRGAAYRIQVRNRLDCRVGVVIAVDGRNIISGGKSWLGHGERMYVLEPGEVQALAGWRTGQDQVNRFYFTSVPDSYAGAFGDTSAMGVVAMAVYPEFRPLPPPCPAPIRLEDRAQAKAAAPASEAAGTGFGEAVHSPSFTVAFQPEAAAREKCYIKYEWRETLVRLGVLRAPRPGNRLWDDGYAPPPPERF